MTYVRIDFVNLDDFFYHFFQKVLNCGIKCR